MAIRVTVEIDPNHTPSVPVQHPEQNGITQISFETPEGQIAQWEDELNVSRTSVPTSTASAVALTPQQPHDQRKEIYDTSKRNDHLMKLDERLSEANSVEAYAKQIRAGRKSGARNAKSYEDEAKGLRDQAKAELLSACGDCAITGCQIRGNFKRWDRIHETSTRARTRDQEPRDKWRKRLIKDLEAGCVPPKKPKK